MKRLLLLLLFSSLPSIAQEDAWVYFNDKPDAATYLANPLTMLTQRALDRRAAQGIALDQSDVPVSESYVNQVEAADGITVMARSRWLNCVHVRGTQTDIAALSGLPFVASVDYADDSLDAAPRTAAPSGTSAVRGAQQVMVDYNYGNSANQIQLVNGHILHQDDYTGAGKIIAVLDTGFSGVDTGAPFVQLQSENRVLGGYNFVTASTNFYTGGSHGTSVLSTMAGYVDGQLVGTAPAASYYLFATEDINDENPVEESWWVEAAERADYYGADIINSSLGYFGFNDPAYSYTYEDMDGSTAFITRGADMAASKGIVVVVSAGNSGATSQPHISAPADAFNVLTVGAVASTGLYASFSSVGPSFDGRVKPDVVAKGIGDVVALSTGALTTSNGTSFSAPIVAGLVACLWQALPDLTATQIIERIRQTASQYSTPDAFLGYGIANFSFALGTTALVSNDTVQLFPNPVQDVLQLNPNGHSGMFRLYNAMGQRLLQVAFGLTAQQIDLSGWGAGVYFYEVQTDAGRSTGSLLKR